MNYLNLDYKTLPMCIYVNTLFKMHAYSTFQKYSIFLLIINHNQITIKTIIFNSAVINRIQNECVFIYT